MPSDTNEPPPEPPEPPAKPPRPPRPHESAPPPILVRGAPPQTLLDAARFLRTSSAQLRYLLYSAPPSARYARFEIPKRSGGVRLISAPTRALRGWQDQLKPLLEKAYFAHEAAHGFIAERSIVTNARLHAGQRTVLNVDLADFFPSVNFGRVRGMFMAAPFRMGPAAATIFAQICTDQNGLPQGAPTSPILSNLAAASLDRRLARLAREKKLRYSRYADDITFSTDAPRLPDDVCYFDQHADGRLELRAGEALSRAIMASGFSINAKKLRLQPRSMRQGVTGLTVNARVNVDRRRIRRLRAMLHAWEKFGLQAAGAEHFAKHRRRQSQLEDPGQAFRQVVYGQLAFVKMVRGAEDALFLKLCAKLIKLDPNPSKFVREMAFGAADYDIFISHAREDKDEIARPIFEACEKLGLKAFLDAPHIAYGENFTMKINTALGASRTVLAIISPVSVTKDWPLLEVNTALAFEVSGDKVVIPVIVGNPDLSKLPLIRGKNWLVWKGDAMVIAKALKKSLKGDPPPPPKLAPTPALPPIAPAPPTKKPGLLARLFGRKP